MTHLRLQLSRRIGDSSRPYLGRETNTGGISIRRTAAIIAAALALTAAGTAQANSAPILDRIHHSVHVTHHYQKLSGHKQTPYGWKADKRSCSARCRAGYLGYWQGRARHARRVYESSPAYVCHTSSTANCINAVFGSYGSQANRVASCESGHSIYARNGQYLGMFQEGDFARSRYGFAWDAYVQSKSAYHYFVDAGRDWSPWTCQP